MPFFAYGQREIEHLKRNDAQLGEAIDRIGRVERPVNPDLFASLAGSIVAQQVSAKAAETVWGRLAAKAGNVTPASIAALSVEEVRSCGMSGRKAGNIKGVAQAALEGELDLEGILVMSDEDVVATLSALPGVGIWTAEMMLIFCLQRPDVVSWRDLAIRRGMMNLYGLGELRREDFQRLRERYSPYGTVASLYLWRIAHEQNGVQKRQGHGRSSGKKG
jgi:DNA-3-methyladenine glycosylase II